MSHPVVNLLTRCKKSACWKIVLRLALDFHALIDILWILCAIIQSFKLFCVEIYAAYLLVCGMTAAANEEFKWDESRREQTGGFTLTVKDGIIFLPTQIKYHCYSFVIEV